MQRPEQHEINTLAQRYFENTLPATLVVRWQNADDYGIDAEIEHFEGGHTTGAIFKVQLKRTRHPGYSVSGDSFAFSFELDKADYLIEQVEIPTVIIRCDVDNRRVFWVDVHGNRELLQAYQDAKTKDQKSFTIRFRTKNSLPDTLNEMLHALHKGNNIIALKRSARIETVDYARYAEEIDDIDAEILHLREKIDIIQIEKLNRLIDIGQVLEAHELMRQIVESAGASAIAKFSALVSAEQIFILVLRMQGQIIDQQGGFEKARFDIWQAQELAKLSDRLPANLQRLTEGYSLAAQLEYVILLDFNLFMNWKVQQSAYERDGEALEPFWYAMAPLVRQQHARRILDNIDASSKLINQMMQEGYWETLVWFTARIVNIVPLFVLRLKAEELVELAQRIEQWIRQVVDMTVGVADHLIDQEHADKVRFVCAMALVQTAKDEREITNHSLVERANEITNSIRDETLQQMSEKQLAAILSRNSTAVGTEEKLDWETLERYYRQQATALGVDLDLAHPDSGHPYVDDSDDARIARIINLGIKDLNPTRVLRNCRHLIFEYSGGIGIPAQMIGLYSARRKRFACIRHLEHGLLESLSLDDGYALFYERNCASCADNEPHDSGWEYSEDWHKQKLEELRIAQEAHRKHKKG